MIDFLLIFCIKIKSNQNIFVFYSEYDQKVNANEWYLSQINRGQRIEKYMQGIQGDNLNMLIYGAFMLLKTKN